MASDGRGGSSPPPGTNKALNRLHDERFRAFAYTFPAGLLFNDFSLQIIIHFYKINSCRDMSDILAFKINVVDIQAVKQIYHLEFRIERFYNIPGNRIPAEPGL